MRTLSVIAAGVMSVWLMGCSQPAQNDAQSGSAAAMPDAKTIADAASGVSVGESL